LVVTFSREPCGATRQGTTAATVSLLLSLLGVAIAFVGTGRARADTGLEQRPHYKVVPAAWPGKNPRRRITDIGTRLTQRDAFAQGTDVLFDEI
jgi:hypothetical protein